MKLIVPIFLIAIISISCNRNPEKVDWEKEFMEAEIPISAAEPDVSTELIDIVVPDQGDDWIDHSFEKGGGHIVISTPPGWTVEAGELDYYEEYNVSKISDPKVVMQIEQVDTKIKEDKEWYGQSQYVENMRMHLDTENEILFGCTDLSQPDDYQEVYVLLASSMVGGDDYYTWVLGYNADLMDDESHAFSLEDSQTMLGIFRTVRLE